MTMVSRRRTGPPDRAALVAFVVFQAVSSAAAQGVTAPAPVSMGAASTAGTPVAPTAAVLAPEAVVLDERLPDFDRTVFAANGAQPVRTAGSTTLTPLLSRWADSLKRIHPAIEIRVAGGGTGAGFAALVDGSADLAAMSRPASANELAAFSKKHGGEPTALVVGVDAIAIYVHKSNPVAKLSLRQIDAIFGAERRRGGPAVRAWSDLGVADTALAARPLVLRGPATTHGLYGLFQADVLRGGAYRLEMISEIVPSIVVQNTGADDAGIGFASRYYQTRRTRMVPIAETEGGPAILPTHADSLAGRYPLARKLYLYVNRAGKTRPTPAIDALLRYACAKQGQADALAEGAYPLDAPTSASECASRL